MRIRSRKRLVRSGVVMAEAAIVLPVLFMFLIGTITIGQGVFLYQQVAELAREGARQAIVHGSRYASENTGAYAWGTTSSPNDQITTYVKGLAVGLNTANPPLTITSNPTIAGLPGSKMRVTVSYQWTPLMYIGNTITLSSTSEMVVTY